jgi:septal ring factor EnvC (AmiA/AmiB activator)
MTRRALVFLFLVLTAFPLSAAGITITTKDGKTHTWQNWYETSSSICTVMDDEPTCISKRRVRNIQYPPAQERLRKLRGESAKAVETQMKQQPAEARDLEERLQRAEERMAEVEKRLRNMEEVLINIESMLLELYRQ